MSRFCNGSVSFLSIELTLCGLICMCDCVFMEEVFFCVCMDRPAVNPSS